MTEHELDHTHEERLEDLDVTGEESEDVRGGCQNNLAQGTGPAAQRATKIDAFAIKQTTG